MKTTIQGKLVTMKEAPANTMEEKIRRLMDRVSIQEVMYEYARNSDNNNTGGMLSCFTDDCITAYLPGPERMVGKDELRAYYQPFFGPDDGKVNVAMCHYMTNEQIFFESNESAIFYCYMYCWRRDPNQLHDDERWGRYECHFVKESDGEWRIRRLKMSQIPRKVIDVWPPTIKDFD